MVQNILNSNNSDSEKSKDESEKKECLVEELDQELGLDTDQ